VSLEPREAAQPAFVLHGPGAPGAMVSGDREVTGLERMPRTSGKAA
jgi:hypothetical protein